MLIKRTIKVLDFKHIGQGVLMGISRRDQFTGSNNIAKPERLPEGAVVDAVNMDFTVGGKAELRTGFELVRDDNDIRAVFSMGDSIAIVSGGQLIRITDSGDERLADVSLGPVAAVLHNSELFLNTMADSLRISSTVEQWSVRNPSFDLEITVGNFPAGIYKVAVTAVEGGVESGCMPMVVTLGDNQGVRVNVDDGRECRLYCSAANSTTLYYQGTAYPSNLLARPVDDTERLVTDSLSSLPFCSYLESHQSLIVGAQDRFVFYTQPMMPHLHNPEEDYIQFPSPVTAVVSVGAGLYICADKTYFITGLGGPEMMQNTVLEFGAIEGTVVKLPDGSAAWFCKYGQVIARRDGSTELINRASYAPDTAEAGASGFLEHNGNQMIVTTMRGNPSSSALKSNDHWELEVVNP